MFAKDFALNGILMLDFSNNHVSLGIRERDEEDFDYDEFARLTKVKLLMLFNMNGTVLIDFKVRYKVMSADEWWQKAHELVGNRN